MDTTSTAAQAKRTGGATGQYFVKCDECRETMRHTDDMRESAAGGRCEKCRAEINAKLARVQGRAREKHLRQLCVYCGVPFGMHTIQMTLDCANARS